MTVTTATVESLPLRYELRLTLSDADTIRDLHAVPEGADRDAHAISALKIGLIALKQANTIIDADTIRFEGDRLLDELRATLQNSAKDSLGDVSKMLAAYFDPQTGNLTQRLERLVAGDGDLNRLLDQYLRGDDCTVAKTLAAQVGAASPLFRMLSPTEKDGVIATLTESVESIIEEQRETILSEFSLDNSDSALRRLINELTESNGKLKRDFAENTRTITREFSLDNDEGALARLVKKVEAANRSITEQLSFDNEESAISRLCERLDQTDGEIRSHLTLDNDDSSLSRLRRELLGVVERVEKTNADFHSKVVEQVSALTARRDRAARSPERGNDFDESFGKLLQSICTTAGDLYEETRHVIGSIPRCKVGDHLLTFGPDSATPEVAITFEAKDCAGCTMKAARTEIEQARANRKAQFGVFVFSPDAAPDGFDTIVRHDNDLFVVWDSNDVRSDLVIRAAVSICRALARRESEAAGDIDAEQLEKTISGITKQVAKLGEIVKWSSTIVTNGTKIGDSAAAIRENLEGRLEELDEHLDSVRDLVAKNS
jgi:hypothetical protein